MCIIVGLVKRILQNYRYIKMKLCLKVSSTKKKAFCWQFPRWLAKYDPEIDKMLMSMNGLVCIYVKRYGK